MILPFDELNTVRTKLEKISGTAPNGEKRLDKKKACDIVLDYLLYCYAMGVVNVNEMLSTSLVADDKEAEETVYRKVGGKDFSERVSEYAESGDLESIIKVADTDGTRVMNSGADITARKAGAKRKGWNTMGDDVVRDTHSYLEGMTVSIDDVFVTYDGDKARFPGDFENAANNVNCRCWLEYKY